MSKPNRHNTHILETKSNKYFNNCIPDEWFIDKPDHDYGVDYIVNIAINNQVTGLNFSVQLKSTEKRVTNEKISIRLKHKTLGLFNTRLEPVLLVIYVQEDEEAYWYWFNDLDIDLTSSQKTFTINIPPENKLSLTNWDDIFKYVQHIFGIKKLIEGLKDIDYENLSDKEILAWKYYHADDYENAIFYFRNLLKDKPEDINMIEGLAHSLYLNYNYKEALQNINKVLEFSDKPSYHLIKACILAEDGIQNNIKGKIVKAKNIFKKFVNNNYYQDIHHYNYANTLSRLGENEEALKHYKICLELNPNNAEAWKNLAQVYFDINQHDKEIECYNKALNINPNLTQALFSKGVSLSFIYGKDKVGLDLMIEALDNDEDMLQKYTLGHYWLAYSNEKLDNLEESLKWIDKGLDYEPENIYFLNFKSKLLEKHWIDHEWIKNEAINFFEYRLELENNFPSLYFLIIINNIKNEQEIIKLIKKYTSLIKNSNHNTLKKCDIRVNESITFLLHYNKYLNLRHTHPISRYIDHLISELFSISPQFFEILDLIFANCYSNGILEFYNTKDREQMIQKILSELSFAYKSIFVLIPDDNFSEEDAISIMSHVCAEFPTIIKREFGVQVGYLTGALGLDKVEPEEYLTKNWYSDIVEKVIHTTNMKLKLFKE